MPLGLRPFKNLTDETKLIWQDLLMRFEGTKDYVATEDLRVAVNAAITLERPLLVKGEPGTGKTVLAEQVATALGVPMITWNIKSTTKAHQGLYEYDAITRLRDSQLGDERVKAISSISSTTFSLASNASQSLPLLM